MVKRKNFEKKLSPTLVGLVISMQGNRYFVKSQDNEYLCFLKGKFKTLGIRTTNPIAIGDRVQFSLMDINHDSVRYQQGLIHAILPRRNYLIRKSVKLSKDAHILAANLDLAILVATLTSPETPLTFIDRFLVSAEAYGIEAAIVFNKTDLYNDKQKHALQTLLRLYTKIGYSCYTTSVHNGLGISVLKERLSHTGISLLGGLSGVGKSTLINKLIPGLELKTSELSDIHNSGMHTTTHSSMYAIPDTEDAYIIDSPGIKALGTVEIKREEASHFFPEIFKIEASCKYPNCTHTHEPRCAVKQALDTGILAMSRYKSYLSILEDEKASKYREAQ